MVRKRHLIESQRVWLNRAKENAENDCGEKAVKAINECLEILNLIEAMTPNAPDQRPGESPKTL